MNQKSINKILIISILFTVNSFCSHNKQKHQNQHNNNSQRKHPGYQTQQPIVANQNMVQQSMIPQQNMSQQSMMPQQNMIQQSMIPQQNIGQQTTNPVMANSYVSQQNGMMVTSNQIAANGMSMTVVQQLDPVKAAQLVADINALQQNFVILSGILKRNININFYNNASQFAGNQTMAITYHLNDNAFDPTKQIINPNGGYINAPAPAPTAINPFTKIPVTLLDLPALQQIRRLLLNNIQTILFALGDIDACSWNVAQMKLFMGPKLQEWRNPKMPMAYDLNLLRPLWKQSTDYIVNGKLRIKMY